jgi:hypothetical protein
MELAKSRQMPGMRRLALVLLLLAGCGEPPQVGPQNYRLVDSLRTAVSARRTDWLDENARLIEKLHAEGKLTDEQQTAFDAIVAKARADNWEEAEQDVLALAKAQRPGDHSGPPNATSQPDKPANR